VLLPLSLVLALGLVSQGVMQNFSAYVTVTTLENEAQVLPMGPVASQIAIKQLGTNGGGFFGANSAHPLENPTPLANFLETLALLLIPSALVFMFGVILDERKQALMIYIVMLSFLFFALGIGLWSEYLPNHSLFSLRPLEGKELRFGNTASILWAVATTAASNGSVNAMHDSLSPLAGGLALIQILFGEVIFGGVGSGLYGMLLYALLTVFLAGLMVGRTPEYLGKKIAAFDIQMVLVGLVAPSAVVLCGAALSSVLSIGLSSLGNLGPHGLSEILYAWASTSNNNGSAFGGLNANTNFYNVGLSLAMIIGRFGVIFPTLAIAGSLANKKAVEASPATLATDTPIFAVLLVFVIIIISALTFLPAFALGPLVEHLLMLAGKTF
jgi:K+-transporting ATPase ATPase A chain